MDYDFARDGITQTMLSTWLECRLKAAFELDGLTPLKESLPQAWGTIAHDALATAGSTGDMLQAVRGEGQRYRAKYGARWDPERVEDHEKMLAQLESVMPAYSNYWRPDDEAREWVELEREFSVPFAGTRLRGKRDGAFRDKTGALWLRESKFRGQIVEGSMLDTLQRDFQINFYLLALWLELDEIPAGCLYDVARRPGLKVTKKDNGLQGYAKRVKEHVEKDFEHYFFRFEVPFSRHDLDVFHRELEAIVVAFGEWVNEDRSGWRYGMPCSGIKGNCRFIPACYFGEESGYTRREKVFPELEG